jgi:hypothetical protein
MEATLTFNPTHFEVASEDVRINGALVEIDAQTGRATAIRRVCLRQADADRLASKPQPAPRHAM